MSINSTNADTDFDTVAVADALVHAHTDTVADAHTDAVSGADANAHAFVFTERSIWSSSSPLSPCSSPLQWGLFYSLESDMKTHSAL